MSCRKYRKATPVCVHALKHPVLQDVSMHGKGCSREHLRIPGSAECSSDRKTYGQEEVYKHAHVPLYVFCLRVYIKYIIAITICKPAHDARSWGSSERMFV